jgi:hypothetical protein
MHQRQQRGRIAAGDQQRGGELEQPRQRQRAMDQVRQQHAGEHERNHPPPEQQHQGEAQPGSRIPRRDSERRIGLDQADPVEQHVADDIDDADHGAVLRQGNLHGRRSLRLASFAHRG